MSDLFASDTRADLCQWFTPAWAAEAIVEQKFSWLPSGSKVIEPACGDGAFLCALPQCLDVVGIDIDPVVAARARAASGRRVLVGDFRHIPSFELGSVQAIIGNPPMNSPTTKPLLRL